MWRSESWRRGSGLRSNASAGLATTSAPVASQSSARSTRGFASSTLPSVIACTRWVYSHGRTSWPACASTPRLSPPSRPPWRRRSHTPQLSGGRMLVLVDAGPWTPAARRLAPLPVGVAPSGARAPNGQRAPQRSKRPCAYWLCWGTHAPRCGPRPKPERDDSQRRKTVSPCPMGSQWASTAWHCCKTCGSTPQ